MIGRRGLSIEIDRRIVGVESAQVYVMRRRGRFGVRRNGLFRSRLRRDLHVVVMT